MDDEPQLTRALAINLRARHYEVDVASDGRAALDLAAHRHPDVVLLDLGLPDLDGVEVIRGLRGWTQIPIIVLSARQGSEDKVEALDAADDYATKPFGMDERLPHCGPQSGAGCPRHPRTRWCAPLRSPSTWPPSGSPTPPAKMCG